MLFYKICDDIYILKFYFIYFYVVEYGMSLASFGAHYWFPQSRED